MTIAIHTSGSQNGLVTKSFNYNYFSLLALEKPEHHFIFICDTPLLHSTTLPFNCTPVTLLPKIKNNLLRYYWYNAKIPLVLEKYNADVFITSGITCSLRTHITQCLMVETAPFKKKPGLYLKKFLPLFISKASAIVFKNPFHAKDLRERYPASVNKIKVLPGLTNLDTPPVGVADKEFIKETFTKGSDFFLYDNSADRDLIMVMKAFSIFKKWQKSDLKLVVSFKIERDPSLLKEVSSYKFRNDVLFIDPADFQNVLPAAYNLLVTGKTLNSSLLAMQRGVPVIHAENEASSILSGAAVYSLRNEKDLGSKMMEMYKDEHFRDDCIARGYDVSAHFSISSTHAQFWKLLDELAVP